MNQISKEKRKRNFIESIIKDLNKGFSRIFWYLYTNIKYNYLSFIFLVKKNKVKDYGISVLVPTKNRSFKFKKMLQSLIKTKSPNFKIELLVFFDPYEEELNQYMYTIKKYSKNVKIKYFFEDFKKNSERINFLASKSKLEIILLINDDLIFCLRNWNEVICNEFSKINIKKPYSLWLGTNDIKYKYFHSNFPVINKAWYKKLNYHSPSKYFQHWWSDNWICDLGKKSGKFLVSKDIFFIHDDKFDSKKLDKLYIENEKKRNIKKDYENWIRLNYIRKKDAKKILN